MEDYPELNRNKATVKVFVDGKILMFKFFRGRLERYKWMQEITIQLQGVENMYFEVAHVYGYRKAHEKSPKISWEAKVIKLDEQIEKAKEVIKKPRQYYPREQPDAKKAPIVRAKAEYSNHSPMRIASIGIN